MGKLSTAGKNKQLSEHNVRVIESAHPWNQEQITQGPKKKSCSAKHGQKQIVILDLQHKNLHTGIHKAKSVIV